MATPPFQIANRI